MGCPRGFERSVAPERLDKVIAEARRILEQLRLGVELPSYKELGLDESKAEILVTPQACKRPVSKALPLPDAREKFGVSLVYGELVRIPNLVLIDVDLHDPSTAPLLWEKANEMLVGLPWGPTRRGLHIYAAGEAQAARFVTDNVTIEVINCSSKFCTSPVRTLDHIVHKGDLLVNPYVTIREDGYIARDIPLVDVKEALRALKHLLGVEIRAQSTKSGGSAGVGSTPAARWRPAGVVDLETLISNADRLPPCVSKLLSPTGEEIYGTRFARIALLFAGLATRQLCLRGSPEEFCRRLAELHGWPPRDERNCIYKVRSIVDKDRLPEGLLCYKYGYDFPFRVVDLEYECQGCPLRGAQRRPACLGEAIARLMREHVVNKKLSLDLDIDELESDGWEL